MKKILALILAGLLLLTLVACDGSDDPNVIIDNKIEADDLFGDVEDDTEAVSETEAVSDTDTEAETSEETAE